MKPGTALAVFTGSALASAAWASPSRPLTLHAPPPTAPAPAPPNSDVETLPRGPRPASSPVTWVTPADYPLRALRDDQQGIVAFRLGISPEGLVDECQIVSSSGSPVLDQATCDLIRQRARFTPAIEAAGKPVRGSYSNHVRWVIPRPMPPEPGEMVVSFLVGPDGEQSGCRVEIAVGVHADALAQRNPCQPTYFAKGYVNADGQPVTRRVRMTMKFEVLPVP